MTYDSIIPQLKKWHEKDEHQKIIDAIEKIPHNDRDYELSSLYARALNNMERYEEALGILLALEETGREDGFWYFRVGYSLYYLDREEEAAEYFQKAIDRGDNGEDTRYLLELSLEAVKRKRQTESGGHHPELYSDEEINCIEAHIEKYFGEFKNVFHEMVSPDIHVDIVIIEPVPERNYYVLVTMGMGAYKMNVPDELEELERAELLICLPPKWNLQNLNDENCYWPLRWLKIMARLPIEQHTWLGWGHTVPNGSPFADNTRFTTMMLLNPGDFAEEACECTMPDGSTVNFYQMIPLYEEEADYKVQNNAEKLLEFFDDRDLRYVKLNRKNVIKTGR
jgi:tetratricopeptide (TPR) repeat protein